jgi:hypothetical protein
LPRGSSFFSQLSYIRHSKAECDGDHGFKSFSRDFDRWTMKNKPFQVQAIPKMDEYGSLVGFMISAPSPKYAETYNVRTGICL